MSTKTTYRWPPVVVTMLTLAASAQAQDAAAVVDNVRTALGIDAFERADKAVRLGGPFENMGLKGTHTLVFDAAGRFRRTSDSHLAMDAVFDGTTVRSRDIGGEVSDQFLGDRTEALFNVWAVTGLWFSKDRCKGFTLEKSADNDSTIVLNLSLDDDHASASVTIDKTTWLPTTWVYRGPLGDSTMTFDGQTRAGPLVLPKDVRITTDNGSKIFAGTSKVEWVAVPPWSSELASMKVENDASFDPGVPSRLKVKKAPTGHLMVHPLVAGKDLGWFIFDTGAGQNVLDQRVIAEAGLETFGAVPAIGVGGATMAAWARPKTLQLGPLTLQDPLTVVMDLAFLDPYMGVKVAGVIGYGTFARCAVEIDLAEGAISIHDPANYELNGAAWTPLIIYNRVPCVPGRFEGHDASFRPDTGASGTLTFHAPTVERLKLLDGRETESATVGGVGGMKAAQAGKVKWLEFGGKRHKKVKATFATEAEGAFADPYIDANIGGSLIGKSVMVLDYPHSRIAFKWKPKSENNVGEETAANKVEADRPVPGTSKRRTKQRAPTPSAATPMEMVNDRPVIALWVQGRGPYRFVFDTGAGVAIVSPELAKTLNLKSTGKTRIGDPAAPHAVEVDTIAVDLEICGEVFKGVSAVVWGDKAILSGLGDVEGIVGPAAIGDRVITLDFAEKQFRLSREPLPEGHGTVACINDHGIPMMTVTIGGLSLPAHLDTGKTRDLSIPASFRNDLVFKVPPVDARGRTASGEFEMEIATLDGVVELAGQRIVDPELEMVDRFEHGVVGTGILARFVVELDLANERARFTPIKGWTPPASQQRRYGMMMTMGDGPVTIASVVPQSIAERGGVRRGDRILKCNGKDFESLNFGERVKIMRESPLALTIERDGKPFVITLAFDDSAPSDDDANLKTTKGREK